LIIATLKEINIYVISLIGTVVVRYLKIENIAKTPKAKPMDILALLSK
jgi:hypothetical protein